jgi:hypothetical protein
MVTKEDRDLLRKNKYGPVLEMWLGRDAQLDSIASALRKNRTVTTVSVFVEDDFNECLLPDLVGLFQAIGSLPLQNLYIYSFGPDCDVFPVRLLMELFERARKLEVLALYFIELSGKNKHFRAFEQALRRHPSIREFRLENCRISDEQLNTYSFYPFVEALRTLPKIEKVDLFATELGFLGTMNCETIAALAAIKLTSLSLINFPLGNDHINALSNAIAENEILTDLSISCDPKYCSALAPMISTNKTLTSVKVRLEAMDNDGFLQSVAMGLKDNTSITRFELQAVDQDYMSEDSQRAFADMLEENITVEHMDIGGWTSEDAKMKARFFLKLNQTGKRGLMQNLGASKDELVDALADAGDDLSCLNHFLATKPSLIHE